MDKKQYLIRFISGEDLLKRWNSDFMTLDVSNLQAYEYARVPEQDFDEVLHKVVNVFPIIKCNSKGRHKFCDKEEFENSLFLIEQIEQFEKENSGVINGGSLTKMEHQKLGQLQNEKKKWNESLKAAISIGLWLSELPDNPRITHEQLAEKIFKEFPDIPKTTIKKNIWKAIPQKYRHQGDHIKS